MEAKIRQWGNSLALRIPRDYARTLQLQEGTSVILELHQETLLIRAERKKPTLDELLLGVTPELVGGEEDWGAATGAEEW